MSLEKNGGESGLQELVISQGNVIVLSEMIRKPDIILHGNVLACTGYKVSSWGLKDLLKHWVLENWKLLRRVAYMYPKMENGRDFFWGI